MVECSIYFCYDIEKFVHSTRSLNSDECGYLVVSNALNEVFDTFLVSNGNWAARHDFEFCISVLLQALLLSM